MNLLCFDLLRQSRKTQLCVAALGIIVLNVCSAYYVQATFALPGFRFGWFFSLFELAGTGICAVIHRAILARFPPPAPPTPRVRSAAAGLLSLQEMDHDSDEEGEEGDRDHPHAHEHEHGPDLEHQPKSPPTQHKQALHTSGTAATTSHPYVHTTRVKPSSAPSLAATPLQPAPMWSYCVMSFLYLLTRGLTNTSLSLIDFATLVVLKSCKIVPVMIGSTLILRKRYTRFDYSCVAIIVCGLILFTSGDSKGSAAYSHLGLFLVVASLVTGAAVGNIQEWIMVRFTSSPCDMLMYMGLFGSFFDFLWLWVSGEWAEAAEYGHTQPIIYWYMALSSLIAYFALCFVMNVIQEFGAAVTVIITSCRKFLTVILSVIMFDRSMLSASYVMGAALVFAGLTVNSWYAAKQHKKKGGTKHSIPMG